METCNKINRIYIKMEQKIDQIIDKVDELRLEKVRQDAINEEVYKAITTLNDTMKDQSEYLDNLSFFAWMGKNWKELMAGILTIGGLVIAWIGLKK